MFFIFLVYLSAITLETLGCYISVIGLAAKTGPLIIFLAITLDFSKVMIATVLYKKWKDLHLLLKVILVPVLFFLVTVTSTGTYAYLVQEFGKTTAVSEQQKLKISLLQTEKDKLEKRKDAIDTQVSQLPPESVVQRRRMIELFSKESTYIDERLRAIDVELPAAQLESMQERGNMGTLGSIASAYNVSPEQVTKIVAFLIVLVIDPLAIVLLTVANFLVEQRKKEIKQAQIEKEIASKTIPEPNVKTTTIEDYKEINPTVENPNEPVTPPLMVQEEVIEKTAESLVESLPEPIITEKEIKNETSFINKTMPQYQFNYNMPAFKISPQQNKFEDTKIDEVVSDNTDDKVMAKEYIKDILDGKIIVNDKDFYNYHDSQKNIPIFEAEANLDNKDNSENEELYWNIPEGETIHDLKPIDFLKKIKDKQDKKTNIPGFNISSVSLD